VKPWHDPRIQCGTIGREIQQCPLGQTQTSGRIRAWSVLPPTTDMRRLRQHFCLGRVEDGRGSLGHSATLRFPSPLIEPDVPD
jgi:hypothetical protein